MHSAYGLLQLGWCIMPQLWVSSIMLNRRNRFPTISSSRLGQYSRLVPTAVLQQAHRRHPLPRWYVVQGSIDRDVCLSDTHVVVNPKSRRIIATGQVGKDPAIHVW